MDLGLVGTVVLFAVVLATVAGIAAARVLMRAAENDASGRLLLDGARVGCPIRGGDVEIEQCFACGKLLRVIDDDPPYVMCASWRTDPRLRELMP